MGGPDSLEAIQPFLENLFSDPEIFNFPGSWLVRKPLAKFISRRRSVCVRDRYRYMGGKSPLIDITREQAEALAERLGPGYSVHVAMRYWHPFADEAVREAKKTSPGRIVILPLYPHYSRATTGTSLSDMERALEAGGLGGVERKVIRSWETFPPYVEALAGCVREAVTGAVGEGRETFLLFSAHGLPVRLIEKGDPYLRHVEATVAAVMERFGGLPHQLAFQSRAGPVKWLEPSVEDALTELGKKGVEDVTVVAVSFVSDHIETLHEIDVEYRELAERVGIKRFRRAPSLNARPDFIRALEACVREI
jgi:ferrochelatase